MKRETTPLVGRATGPAGTPAADFSGAGAISADGRVVAFISRSALDPAGSNGQFHVYARDLAAQTTTIADRDNGNAEAVAAVGSFEPAIDADGGRVAFTTTAAIAGAPPDVEPHVYVRDLSARTTTLVSRAEGISGASASGASGFPTLDAAGDVVAFISSGQNLAGPIPNGEVFVRHILPGHTRLVSRASGATGSIASAAEAPSLDAAGDRVSFSAYGGIENPPPPSFAVYVRDLPSETTTLASRSPTGAAADGRIDLSSISASGNCVAFAGSSTNLGDGFSSADFAAVHMFVLSGECAPSPRVPTT